MNEHTPGPWTYEPRTRFVLKGAPAPNAGLAPIIAHAVSLGKNVGLQWKETNANGHLMAAAPDLYAACKALVQCNRDIDIDPAIYAAIEKAEGES